MGNLNLYDTARQLAEGAGKRARRRHALRDAMKDPQTPGHNSRSLIDRLMKLSRASIRSRTSWGPP